MPYTDLIDSSDADPLIPVEVSREIITTLEDDFWLLNMARRLPPFTAAQKRMPVLSALATAYFLDGDTGLKQTTDVEWENKYIDAEEIAAIVPISQSALDDTSWDLWGEVRPTLEAAFSKTITQAVLYGTNIPTSWTTNLGAAGLVAFATAASQNPSLAAFADEYEAILGESAAGSADGVLMLIEADGFMATGHVGHISMRGRLRNARDSDGHPIFTGMPQDPTRYALDGAPIAFPLDGSIDSSEALLISGDWTKLVYAIRQEITFTMHTDGVISDSANNIVINLMQQDMVALRAVIRLGFALPNPINQMEAVEASRCPFAILTT